MQRFRWRSLNNTMWTTTVRCCHRSSRHQREPNINNRSRGYEHYYAFIATMVDPNADALADDNESTDQGFFTTETEEELYQENKKLHTILQRLDNFLRVQHPELLRPMEKINLFDEMADGPEIESGGSHQTSTMTLNVTAHTTSRTLLYKPAYVNLNNDLKAESECKPTAQREEQREGESLHVDTSTVASYTKEGLVASDGEILKIKSILPSFKKMLFF
jgi:hypothetical protein